MALKVLPPSPNWYLSSVSDANYDGIYVYGSKQNVYVFDISIATSGPRMIGCYTGHTDRVTSVALNQVVNNTVQNIKPDFHFDPEVTEETKHSEDAKKSNGMATSQCCSAGDDMLVRIWDVNTQSDVQSHSEHKNKVTAVSWSLVNNYLIASGDEKGEVVFWNRKCNILTKWRQEKDYIFCMSFCPHDPALLAIGFRQGTVFLVDFSTGTGYLIHRLRGHEDEVMSLSWCPIPGENFLKDSNEMSTEEVDKSVEGCLIATSSKDRSIRIWSRTQGKQLFMKKMPQQRHEHREQGGRVKVWVAVHWLKHNPEQLVSSSLSGDLLLWNLKYSKSQAYQTFYSGEFKSHMRPIFNICAGGLSGRTLCTFSQDRMIVLWDAETTQAVCSFPTLGGFVYCLRNSPIDPGRVAIGVGDNMIRVWNTSNKTNLYDVTTMWQGIKSKVTTVAWHPLKEGSLGFGTFDGRVGVCDVLSHKMPLMSGTFHSHTVYVVAWGPPASGIKDNSSFSLYSVGDCKILEHNTSCLSKAEDKTEALDFTQLLVNINSQKLQSLRASELSWNFSLNAFAVGTDDGSVYIFMAESFTLLATIRVHLKLLNCIRWHPFATGQSPGHSPCFHWVASGGNDQILQVVDLTSVFGRRKEDKGDVLLTNSLRKLVGHNSRITDICWSPHQDGRIVSVGYDAEIFVWDILKGVALCQFRGHHGRLFTCQFGGLDPDLVMTAGTDSALMAWRPSEQPSASLIEKKKKKKKKPHAHSSTVSENIDPCMDISSRSQRKMEEIETEMDNLHRLLEKKRQELNGTQEKENYVGEEDGENVSSDRNENTTNNAAHVLHSADTASTKRIHTTLNKEADNATTPFYVALTPTYAVEDSDADSEERANSRERKVVRHEPPTLATIDVANRGKGLVSVEGGGKKKRRSKSFFPETAAAENKGRLATYEDLFFLTKFHALEETDGCKVQSLSSDKFHLGLFTDRTGTYQCLQQEKEHHVNHDNMDYALQMEVWKGNIMGALQFARERNQLTDWIVSLAPLASYEMWLQVCEEYAEQLEEDGQYHKAVSYLLACNKLYQAIDLFRRHKQFREAVSLARVRLSPLDPVLEDLYNDWSEQLMRDGAYEQAAKCYLAMKQIQDAANVIARRCEQNALKAACQMTLLANEKSQGQLYAQQVITRYMEDGQWSQALSFLKEHQPLKVFVPYVSMHKMVAMELMSMVPDIVNPVENDDIMNRENIAADKAGIPVFILDPNDTDPVLPWEPHLIGNHTFAHQMLRLWHMQLGVSMETEHLQFVYRALQQLHSGRQAHLDIQKVLLQVCADVTLWLLALLLNQTSHAISHLLSALSTLHDAGHHKLLTALCRLLLPQGPKYVLKLQHEVTAVRVLISMDAHVHVEGGGKHLSLHRYLSELKEEASVSTGSVRCRQLDCVRAYYYLAILHHLQQTAVNPIDDVARETSAREITKDINSQVLKDVKEKQGVTSDYDMSDKSGISIVQECGSDDTGISIEFITSHDKDQNSGLLKTKPAEVACSGANIIKAVIISPTKHLSTDRIKPDWNLTLPMLSLLSKGLLWDIQAKRLALTETLGYIHRAISNHLLTDSTKEIARTLSHHSHASGLLGIGHHLHSSVLPDSMAAYFPADPASDSFDSNTFQPLCDVNSSKANPSVEPTSDSLDSSTFQPLSDVNSSKTNPGVEPTSDSLDSSTFQPFDMNSSKANPDVEPISDVSKVAVPRISKESSSPSQLSPHSSMSSPELSKLITNDKPASQADAGKMVLSSHDLLGESNFDLDLATLGQQWDGSRRVLWEDDRTSGLNRWASGHWVGNDGSSHKPTSLFNPAKYINVPDEWYSLPVDDKYARTYVTLSVLKDEQDFVMGELKYLSDNSQVPFPSPFSSVDLLVNVCITSTAMATEDKHNYLKSLLSWAMHFAVTAQQRGHIDTLFSQAEKELGL